MSRLESPTPLRCVLGPYLRDLILIQRLFCRIPAASCTRVPSPRIFGCCLLVLVFQSLFVGLLLYCINVLARKRPEVELYEILCWAGQRVCVWGVGVVRACGRTKRRSIKISLAFITGSHRIIMFCVISFWVTAGLVMLPSDCYSNPKPEKWQHVTHNFSFFLER